MLKEWSVRIETGTGASGTVADGHIEGLLEALAPHHVALSGAQDGSTIGASMTFTGSSIGDAILEGMRTFEKALIRVGLGHLPIDFVEAKTMAALEREIDTPNYPELVGVSEIGEILGVSRQRASALTTHPQFPRALAELAAGPVWPREWITRFVEEWKRRPGRPVKVPVETVRTATTVGEESAKHRSSTAKG